MKTFLMILAFASALPALAQRRNTIDDLGTIRLNLDAPATEAHDVHYPNYRMGGGNRAGRSITDCLLLDIRHSDVIVTPEQKLKVANALKVVEGFDLADEDGEGRGLVPEVKGNNVVFLMHPVSLYMTSLQVRTRDGRYLDEVIKENLPPVRAGNDHTPPTGLVYVRDCRF